MHNPCACAEATRCYVRMGSFSIPGRVRCISASSPLLLLLLGRQQQSQRQRRFFLHSLLSSHPFFFRGTLLLHPPSGRGSSKYKYSSLTAIDDTHTPNIISCIAFIYTARDIMIKSVSNNEWSVCLFVSSINRVLCFGRWWSLWRF